MRLLDELRLDQVGPGMRIQFPLLRAFARNEVG